MKLHLNTTLDIQISPEEIELYHEMKGQKDLSEVGTALLDLVNVVHTEPAEQWIEAASKITARPEGPYSDSSFSNFIGLGLHRCLALSQALKETDTSKQLRGLFNGMAYGFMPLLADTLTIEIRNTPQGDTPARRHIW